MNAESKQIIGVVGAGAMGRGIVQLFAEVGHIVWIYDTIDGAAQKARDFVAQMLGRAVEKGRYTSAQAEVIVANIRVAASLCDFSNCDVAIEAIVEEISAKQKVFAAIEAVVGDTTLIVSNTSSLMIAEIADGCRLPQRVAGLHFFNPVPLMKVVEVIAAVRTAPATVSTLRELITGTGHRAVIAADQPGFLVNHAGRGLYTEGLRILEEQAAAVADIDTLLREAAGFRMGPFELLDLTGLDVSGKVMESIYEQFQHEPRFRPSSLVRPRIAAGLFGRKSGQGWYVYDGDRKRETLQDNISALSNTASNGEPDRKADKEPHELRVWIDPTADDGVALGELVTAAGARIELQSSAADILLVQFWGQDATGYCAENKLNALRCVAIDPLPGLNKRRTLMLTAVTNVETRDAALALLSADGAAVTVINDSPGFVVQRVLATIVNIAANIAQRGIASVADIEAAVQLGLGYPLGPLSWGDKIGGERVLKILNAMLARTGDPRYRPSLWLQRRVELGLSLLTEEAPR